MDSGPYALLNLWIGDNYLTIGTGMFAFVDENINCVRCIFVASHSETVSKFALVDNCPTTVPFTASVRRKAGSRDTIS